MRPDSSSGGLNIPLSRKTSRARPEDLTISDRPAAQGIGHVLDEEAAHPRMERRGASHDLVKLVVAERERRLIAPMSAVSR
jgi:hypothetical protein